MIAPKRLPRSSGDSAPLRLRLLDDEPNPLDSLAELYLVIGQPEKALENYAAALEMDPDFFSAYGGRAIAYGSMGRYREALAEVERALERSRAAGLDGVGFQHLECQLLIRAGRLQSLRFVDAGQGRRRGGAR